MNLQLKPDFPPGSDEDNNNNNQNRSSSRQVQYIPTFIERYRHRRALAKEDDEKLSELNECTAARGDLVDYYEQQDIIDKEKRMRMAHASQMITLIVMVILMMHIINQWQVNHQ